MSGAGWVVPALIALLVLIAYFLLHRPRSMHTQSLARQSVWSLRAPTSTSRAAWCLGARGIGTERWPKRAKQCA